MKAVREGHALDTSEQNPLFRTLIDSRSELISFLARRLRCTSTAEDIAQDVYIRLMTSKVVALQPRNLIFKTAANLAANHARDERRRLEIRTDDIAPFLSDVEECTPERNAIARDALRRLSRELARWPARTREVFILNRYEGLNLREIAKRLKISVSTTERHLARAALNLTYWTESGQQ
jgi:RNA polymerase sigma factor (sigma-70 family)